MVEPITVPGMFQTGTHAARPAAGDMGKGSLYSCTDHSLIYQTDGSSWTTWATLGGTPTSVPGWVSDAVGTTGTNAVYWDGNDIASFTEVDVTGTTTWSEGRNMASVIVAGVSSEDVNCLLIAKTINTGDAWKVNVKGLLGHTTTGNAHWAGIIFTDGTTSGSNGVAGHIQTNENAGTQNFFIVGRHGTLTAMSTAPWVLDDGSTVAPLPEVWLKLTYVSANTFRLQVSTDDVTYHAFGEADISKTMTPTHVGIFATSFEADGAIATFGPLKKV